MKNNSILFLLSVCCLMSGCNAKKMSAFDEVRQSDPITPIMLTDKMSIEQINLTDYLPTLDGYAAVLPYDDMLEILDNDNATYNITIPIIQSDRKHKQIMFVKELTDDVLTIGFTELPMNFSLQVYWQNILLCDNYYTDEYEERTTVSVEIPKDLFKEGRSYLRVYAHDEEYNYNDLLIPLQDMKPVMTATQLTRHDRHGQVLYSLMVDRFNNGNKDNDWKLNSPEVLDIVDYQGGDLAGITEKISNGFFTDLGINTIWISPITQNPWDAWGYYAFDTILSMKCGEDSAVSEIVFDNKYDKHRSYTRYSGYHGYWPIYVTKIDQRFGTEKELHKLLATAHEKDINVILDYVANHIHISSPILQNHPDWITDSILPDGRRNFELWDEARLTTWFDKHIPTLDLERSEVYEPMTDSALYWLEHFDFDGFRHDACKHIPECYWRTLTKKMKQRFADRSLWMIGETYGSAELINSYVKTGMLDAQFDFNIYFTATRAIAQQDGDMRELGRVIEESLAAYGAHHTMGNISGNHDQVRFISLAGGAITLSEDGKRAGWTRDVTVGDSAIAYRKAAMLHALNLTIPGVPCIYQGDEYGEPGGNDPDNRKMMRFVGLNNNENDLRNFVIQMISLRRNNIALIYGDYLPVYSDHDVLWFKRKYGLQEVDVIINKSDKQLTIIPDGYDMATKIEPYGIVIDTHE